MKFPPPAIPPFSEDGNARPFWSVMIPTYNPRKDYLEQALRSVLVQDFGPAQMQIEVVDDCSPKVDVATMVQKIAGERVAVFRNPVNKGLAGCWNACIERSRGRWVHILHQDDYVCPVFYLTLAQAAERHPEVSLLATRSFIVDKEGSIITVSNRLRDLENGERKVDEFFYMTPIQCPGVAVKRSFYETHGGFQPGLTFALDCEMWSRVVGLAGGLVTSEVLSCYRLSDTNESERLNKTAESLHDLERLNTIFAARFPGFSAKFAQEQICNKALEQAVRFSQAGNLPAAKVHLDYWKSKATAKLWFRRLARKLERMLFS